MNEQKEHKSNGRHALRKFYTKQDEQKLETAKLNSEARAKRTPEEQLALLDERLGVGVGAHEERAKLELAIFDSMSESGKNNFPVTRETLVMELEAICCLRKFGLSVI